MKQVLRNKATEEFFQMFPDKTSCEGLVAMTMVAFDALPVGVSRDDLRVQQIVGWCREKYGATLRLHREKGLRPQSDPDDCP